jgi:hypothetical protein
VMMMRIFQTSLCFGGVLQSLPDLEFAAFVRGTHALVEADRTQVGRRLISPKQSPPACEELLMYIYWTVDNDTANPYAKDDVVAGGHRLGSRGHRSS